MAESSLGLHSLFFFVNNRIGGFANLESNDSTNRGVGRPMVSLKYNIISSKNIHMKPSFVFHAAFTIISSYF